MPPVQIKRTATPNAPPIGLLPGELSVEMANPFRLWVGVPTTLDPSGMKLLVPSSGILTGDVPPATPSPNQLWWETDSGVLWLWYTDADSSQWVQINAAAGGGGGPTGDFVEIAGDTMTGPLVLPADPVAALEAATKQYVDLHLTQAEADPLYVNVTGDMMTGQLNIQRGGAFNNGLAVTNPNVAGGNTGCSFALHDDGACWINHTNGNLGINFAMAGTYIMSVAGSGLFVQPGATGSTYSIDARTSGTAAIIGWSGGTVYYGMVGAYFAPSHYCMYGNTGAFLTGGTWAVSDARLKTVSGDMDPAAALSAVNAIAVRQFAPSTEAARGALYGVDGPDAMFGWIADEVEPLIPLAVRNVTLAADDLATRAAVSGTAIPERDTPEAAALADPDATVKAINDRYMVATLWSAVQALTALSGSLQARIDALEAAPAGR